MIWLSLSISLAIVCVGLGVGFLRYCRAMRRTEAASKEISEAISMAFKLMCDAEENQSFEIRYENPHLVRCWEVMGCQDTDCISRKSSKMRCWQVAGSHCHDPNVRSLSERLKKCKQCKVYLRSQPDAVSRLAEQFNNTMAILEFKAEEAVQAKRHLQQASKLATVGEFAAGIAHEINNPLDGILSCVKRLERDPANLDQNVEYLGLMRDALERMSTVVQRLLEFSQKHELVLNPIEIRDVIENVVALVRISARQNAVSIECDFPAEIPTIIGDKYYLRQAFLNLALNGIAAMPEGGPAT